MLLAYHAHVLVLAYSLSHSSIEEHVDGREPSDMLLAYHAQCMAHVLVLVCSTSYSSIGACSSIVRHTAANMHMYWSAAVYHMKSGSIGHQSTTIPPTVHIFKRMLVSGYRG